jgi:transcriptional regulator with XRE-family HTH domain
MSHHRLPNYLRTHRKRLRAGQRHVAFLLGSKSGTKISRYEHFSRVPDLQTVFALEVIYGVPARELFAGMFEDACRLVEDRAGHAIRGPDATLASFARLILDPSARPPTKPPTSVP